MKTTWFWILAVVLAGLLAGCLVVRPSHEPPVERVVIITVVITTTPVPDTGPLSTAGGGREPVVIATALRTLPAPTPSATPAPSATPTPEPSPSPSDTAPAQSRRFPTPVPDYVPGRGLAVLTGEPPYELSIAPGGWQAYALGPSANAWGYLIDITPLKLASAGAYVESQLLPEYTAGRWMDVLWLRAPGIVAALPVRLDVIPTLGWTEAYANRTHLTPGEWTGWAMFDNAEGCGGVLDISLDDVEQPASGAYIQNTRVQPEFPGQWLQVIRVQLSASAVGQPAWLRYYTPGPLGLERLRQKATLSPGQWNGYTIAPSYVRQGYVVEVVPLKKSDNEVAFATVRPESNGEGWFDVLRVHVPAGRPALEALLRVLAVKVAGQ